MSGALIALGCSAIIVTLLTGDERLLIVAAVMFFGALACS